jgi:hypothetical protein
MSDVQVVKLTTGEDVMGFVEEVDLEGAGKVLSIRNPVAIILRAKDERGDTFGVGLAPYAIYAENHTIPVMPSQVVSVFKPEKKLEDEYRAKVSGIQPVTAAAAKQILKEGAN